MPYDDSQPAVSRLAAGDRPASLATPRGPRWLVVGNLVALALIVTLSTVALTASRRSFENRAIDATDNLARSLQQAIESELDRVDMLLRGIATDYARSSPDSAGLAQLLELRQPLMDADLESLRATDAQGIVDEGRGADRPAPLDLGDREFFRLARDDPRQRLVFTGPLETRTAPRWVVVMARRLDRADGSFGGVVYAHVGIDHFSKRLASAGLGSGGAISLRTTDLRLVARQTGHGADNTGIGQSQVSTQMREAMQAAPLGGHYIATTALDGVERANAYRRLERYPLVVVAGLATADFLAPWREEVALVVALSALTALVLAGSSAVVLRAWRRDRARGQALRASEAFLDRTGRIAVVGGWELDLRSRQFRWSQQACRIYEAANGHQPTLEEALAHVQPDARDVARERMEESIRSGQPWDMELPVTTARGRAIWVRSVAEVELQDGRPARIVGAVQDITEQRQRKAELEREQTLRAEIERHAQELDALLRERGEMLDVLAHEVRQPLNNASAALQSAATVLGEVDERAASLRLSRALLVMGQVMARLDNTLAVASLLARPEPIAREDTDVDALLAVVIADMPAPQRSRIRIERATTTRTASMDMSLMRLALRNLLSNALRHGPPDTPVELRLSDSDHPLALLIDVIDRGPGIDAALVPRLFERNLSPGAAGHVLGLYIVRRVMELHGGRAELVSNRPGEVVLRLVIVEPQGD